MTIRLALAAALLFACLAVGARAAEPARCQLRAIAEWPVRLDRNLPVTDGEINGKKAGVLIDTGAYASLLTKAAATKLDLFTRALPERMIGIGGTSNVLVARLDELRIGDARRDGIRVRVGGERPIPGADFILGEDLLHLLDLEFDYAKGVIRAYEARDCEHAWLAYWDRNAIRLPIEDEASRIVFPVRVNGREASAMLDSGASGSLVSQPFAESVGVTTETPGVVPSSCHTGIGADAVHSWVGIFDSVALGDETIRNAHLPFADLGIDLTRRHPEMILGTDFLRSHRVLVSRSQNRIYFSYTGGLVFPSTPSIDCDERLQGKGAREALAALDEAIAKDPRDTRALLNRALIRLRQGRAKDALPDLDAVLAIEPSNASALAARSAVRTTLRQYDGALADAQSAIDNGMRTAAMYVRRAQIRRAQGDVAGALEEYGHALELDPHDNAALRGRGVALYAAGRFEEAQRDFETALAVRPDGYAALWVAATRMRRGSEPAAPLEAALARLGEGDWPRPIVLHLLGRLDREGLLAAAAPDEKLARGRKCEARFFAAQRLVATAQPAAARLLLQQVLDECPRDYYEYEGAIADLKRLP